MRLQGAPTSVLPDPRVVREARRRQVRHRSRDAEGDLSSGADAKAGPRGRTARLWENRARQSSCSCSRHDYRTSSVLRGYPTMTSSVFLTGIARTRRACSRQDGNRYSRNLKKVLIAANLELRVLAQFLRCFSRCSRKASTRVASICSTRSSEGVTLSRSAAKQ